MVKDSNNEADNFIEFTLYPDIGYQNRSLRLLLDTTKIIGFQDCFTTEQEGGTRKGVMVYTAISSFVVRETYDEVVAKLNILSSVITQA